MLKFTACNACCALPTSLYLPCEQNPFAFPAGNPAVCILPIYLGGRLQPEGHRIDGFLVCALTGLDKYVMKVLDSVRENVFANLTLVFGLFPFQP